MKFIVCPSNGSFATSCSADCSSNCFGKCNRLSVPCPLKRP